MRYQLVLESAEQGSQLRGFVIDHQQLIARIVIEEGPDRAFELVGFPALLVRLASTGP